MPSNQKLLEMFKSFVVSEISSCYKSGKMKERHKFSRYCKAVSSLEYAIEENHVFALKKLSNADLGDYLKLDIHWSKSKNMDIRMVLDYFLIEDKPFEEKWINLVVNRVD